MILLAESEESIILLMVDSSMSLVKKSSKYSLDLPIVGANQWGSLGARALDTVRFISCSDYTLKKFYQPTFNNGD